MIQKKRRNHSDGAGYYTNWEKAGQADAYIVESLPKHASMFHQSPC